MARIAAMPFSFVCSLRKYKVQTWQNKIFQEVGTMDLSKEITYEKESGEKPVTVKVERCFQCEATIQQIILNLLKRRLHAGGGLR
ncbi:hypothetical protein [Lacrimispora sp. 38-1]|uniref:hypothetical protein n=1 Tax=Lacrimispora sp. 38-1 TaxID=3125778 RepID=UPI003CF05FA8